MLLTIVRSHQVTRFTMQSDYFSRHVCIFIHVNIIRTHIPTLYKHTCIHDHTCIHRRSQTHTYMHHAVCTYTQRKLNDRRLILKVQSSLLLLWFWPVKVDTDAAGVASNKLISFKYCKWQMLGHSLTMIATPVWVLVSPANIADIDIVSLDTSCPMSSALKQFFHGPNWSPVNCCTPKKCGVFFH